MSIIKALTDKIQGIPGKRSPHWQTTRKKHLAENAVCSVCGGTSMLEVHHIEPFHLNPKLELDPSNFITLCEAKKDGVTCHLFFGHLGNYKSFNKNVTEDAKLWKEKLKERPEGV